MLQTGLKVETATSLQSYLGNFLFRIAKTKKGLKNVDTSERSLHNVNFLRRTLSLKKCCIYIAAIALF